MVKKGNFKGMDEDMIVDFFSLLLFGIFVVFEVWKFSIMGNIRVWDE